MRIGPIPGSCDTINMNLLVFEDERVAQLHPATTGRPAFAITIAGYCLADWLRELGGPVTSWVRPHLRALLALDAPEFVGSLDPAREWTLLINARAVPSVATLGILRGLRDSGQPCCVWGSGEGIAAAVVPTGLAEPLLRNPERLQSIRQLESALSGLPRAADSLELFQYPHDLVRQNLAVFSDSISHRLATRSYREISPGVFVSGDVAISDFVVTNTRSGPIVIESGTVIGPFCFLRGPIHIGPDSRVNEHSAIKDSVSIGHTCKIGGEVESSVIEPFTNKQHHGFLGHSYLGSWINLGAGTCNSDLKNTYGEVKMDYFRGERIPTGMQFIGCVMGDFSKTAINTSIFTGKTIGVCSMLYGFVTTNVPSFSNYARTFNQVTESPPGVMELTQRRMFARRGVPQRPEDIDLLHAMYEMTRHERQISEEPLNL